MNFEIPEGLTDLLQDFTVEVLRKRPADLLAFAAHYFEELLEKRGDESARDLLKQIHSSGATNSSNTNGNHHHHHQHDNHDDEEDDDMGDMPDLPKGRYGGNRRVSVAAEKYNPEEDTNDEPAVVNPKTETEREYLMKTMIAIFLFRSLDSKQKEKVC